MNNDITVATDALSLEIEGLQALKESIGEDFEQAVDAIDAMRSAGTGRLIIAGIGKSGHVGRKIAATLASTGTPAYYVHPGEASHGDMGMITNGDIVVMLSNSGENQELSDLIAYTRRFSIPLIAMTSNPESSLAKHSDIVLCMPKMKEACPNNMAPTTSTTMMIALGDALAMALLGRIHLSPEDFKVFHPGGKLGQKLLKVSDLMHKYDALPLVDGNDTMDKALLVMTEKNMGSVMVADADQNLKGIITDGDLKRHMSPDLLSKKVCDLMNPTPKTINGELLAAKALDVMLTKHGQPLTALVVVDEAGKLSGLIQLQQCLQAGIA